MKNLLKSCADDLVFLDVVAPDMRSVLQFVLDELAVRGRLDHREIPRALQAFLQREAKSSTAIGHAVAVPHAYLECFHRAIDLRRPPGAGAAAGSARWDPDAIRLRAGRSPLRNL